MVAQTRLRSVFGLPPLAASASSVLAATTPIALPVASRIGDPDIPPRMPPSTAESQNPPSPIVWAMRGTHRRSKVQGLTGRDR